MNTNDPKDPRNKKGGSTGYETFPDETPRREGGDDAIAEAHPTDSRADEKVIVNEQRSDKIVNTPSQSDAHTSEGESNDEDIVERT